MSSFTRDEFERHIAANRKMTVEQIREWLRQRDLVISPCDCGDGGCRGWKVSAPDDDVMQFSPEFRAANQMDDRYFEERAAELAEQCKTPSGGSVIGSGWAESKVNIIDCLASLRHSAIQSNGGNFDFTIPVVNVSHFGVAEVER